MSPSRCRHIARLLRLGARRARLVVICL